MSEVAYDLCGIGPREVWQYTPAEIYFMVNTAGKRLERERYYADFRSGMICSLLANIYRDQKKKPEPFTPQDFMPVKKDKDAKPARKAVKVAQTEDEMLNMIEMVHGCFKDGVM